MEQVEHAEQDWPTFFRAHRANCTAEFLIFQAQDKSQGVEVVYHDETIWATQKAMSVLFDCTTDNINLHLKNIFASGELA